MTSDNARLVRPALIFMFYFKFSTEESTELRIENYSPEIESFSPVTPETLDSPPHRRNIDIELQPR